MLVWIINSTRCTIRTSNQYNYVSKHTKIRSVLVNLEHTNLHSIKM